MIHFNKYVYKTKTGLVNSINKKFLLENSSIEDFTKYFFLDYQEDYVVKDYIENYNKYVDTISILIIPTWQCNLRCSHCCVIERLTKTKAKRILNTNEYIDFIYNLYLENNKKINVSFVGGEPLIESEFCLEIIKKCINLMGDNFNSGLTTNASLELNDSMIELLKIIPGSFGVSLDGVEKYHNKQRISLNKEINPYNNTLKNIKLFCEMNLDFHIQASISEEFQTEEHFNDFISILLKMGIESKDILWGSIHPKNQKEIPTKTVLEYFKNQTRISPCCKYRSNYFLIDVNADVYTDFYEKNESTLIGNLKNNSLDEIKKTKIKKILSTMPCLQDKKCLSCPAIGHCWGGCVNLNIKNPGDYCDQNLKIKLTQEYYDKY